MGGLLFELLPMLRGRSMAVLQPLNLMGEDFDENGTESSRPGDMVLGKPVTVRDLSNLDHAGRLDQKDSPGLSYLDLWQLYNHPEPWSLHLQHGRRLNSHDLSWV